MCYCFIFHFPRQVVKSRSIFRRSNTHNMDITKATSFYKKLEQLKITENTHFTFLLCFLAENDAGGGGGSGEDGKSKTCIIL